MKIMYHYGCGCSNTRDVDARMACNSAIAREARENGNTITLTISCPEHRTSQTEMAIAELSHEDALTIIRKMARNKDVRRLLGVN